MLSSPLFYDKLMGSTIDLSQLAQVSDAFFSDDYNGKSVVGFTYRFASSSEQVLYKRALIDGPYRNCDLSLRDPSKILDTAAEEQFYIVPENEVIPRGHWLPKGSQCIICYEEDESTKPKALIRMEQQVESLRSAWLAWKNIEPEIYAIIRQKLG